MEAPSLLILRNAIENVSTAPLADRDIEGMLRGERGAGGQRCALFSDVSLHALLQAGRLSGVGRRTILAAYAAAKIEVAAANPELDEALQEDW